MKACKTHRKYSRNVVLQRGRSQNKNPILGLISRAFLEDSTTSIASLRENSLPQTDVINSKTL